MVERKGWGVPGLVVAMALGLAFGLPQGAQAQEDPMAMQRCVWACLAQNGPATNPAYHACVERQCVAIGEGNAGAVPEADPTKGWVQGRSGSGVGYAGVDGLRGRTGLYYFCGRGQSFLRVIGIDGGERAMVIEVDGRRFALSFSPNSRNQPESALPYSDPVIAALQGGSRVRVLTYDGDVVDAPLRGSSRALAGVISGC